MNYHPTRRNVLTTAGFTLCSALIGGMAGSVIGVETTTPLSNPNLEPPPVAPGESRASQVDWYMRNGACGGQAFVATYADAVGFPRETAMKIACGFSGGIGLTGEVCSMITGAVMLLGLKNGPANISQKESYEKTVELAKQFSKDFREHHQTVICRELIQFDISTPEQYAKAHEIEGIWHICFQGAKTIADLLENKYDILNRK